MIRKCDICGKENNEQFMQSISTGRRTEWWCWECYINSQREATFSDMYRQKRLQKLNQFKKRNK